MDDPILFFRELGDMHDAKINSIVYSMTEESLTMSVDDINAGFCGLPEYLGKRKAPINFFEVGRVELWCDACIGDIQRVYDFDLVKETDSGMYSVVVTIAPNGRLAFRCVSIEVVYSTEK